MVATLAKEAHHCERRRRKKTSSYKQIFLSLISNPLVPRVFFGHFTRIAFFQKPFLKRATERTLQLWYRAGTQIKD
jgi:hypothetical protein